MHETWAEKLKKKNAGAPVASASTTAPATSSVKPAGKLTFGKKVAATQISDVTISGVIDMAEEDEAYVNPPEANLPVEPYVPEPEKPKAAKRGRPPKIATAPKVNQVQVTTAENTLEYATIDFKDPTPPATVTRASEIPKIDPAVTPEEIKQAVESVKKIGTQKIDGTINDESRDEEIQLAMSKYDLRKRAFELFSKSFELREHFDDETERARTAFSRAEAFQKVASERTK